MACNTCKKSKTTDKVKKENKTQSNGNLALKIRDNTIKFFVFIFLLAIFIPLVIPATIYTLFITVFSNKGINIVPLGLYIGRKLFKEEEEEDDDDLEDEDYDDLLDEDEYELDSNEITVIK